MTFGYAARPRTFAFRGWDRFDYLLLVTSAMLVVYGLVLIHSASSTTFDGPLTSFANPVARQALFAIISLGIMFAISQLDYHYLTHYAWLLYGIGILALIAVLLFGNEEYGSTRWFDLGIIQVQPSEFAKLATILLLARYFSEHGGDARELRALVMSLIIVVPAALLVFIEPDLGTSVVFGAIWLGVVIIAGVNRGHLLVLGAAFFAVLPFAWTFALDDYQVERISVLVNPDESPLDAGYNVIQSQIAVG